jgi:hypothetical protein
VYNYMKLILKYLKIIGDVCLPIGGMFEKDCGC